MSKNKNLQFDDFLKSFQKLKGREKGEAQKFCRSLLKTFGSDDIICDKHQVEFEVPIKIRDIYKYADCVWPGRVVIEMKSRGKDLSHSYHQLAEYWLHLTYKNVSIAQKNFRRPRYGILCNFDEIWIYDFDTQMDVPVCKLKTLDLPHEYQNLSFLYPQQIDPIFKDNSLEITKKVATLMGDIYLSLTERNISSLEAERFVLKLIVALFADDIKLSIGNPLYRILQEENASHQLLQLIKAMSLKPKDKKPFRYADIPYFNGGLFNHSESITLNNEELFLLQETSEQNWAKVNPAIFGSIFEASMTPNIRLSHGVHFTYEEDIQKIIYPTIIAPFREKIEKAQKIKNQKKAQDELLAILDELDHFKVLDPACGSGNFLYTAYRSIVRLEMEILDYIKTNFLQDQKKSSHISLKNFYGIDINSFGVELTKVALSLGKKLACDEFSLEDDSLPFDNLDKNIVCADALFTKWPHTNVIIGNPPFLGKGKLRKELGNDYIEKLRSHFKDTPSNIDFCSYWFRLAHQSKAQRIGLVGTNSVARGFTHEATLKYIADNKGYIYNAFSSQEWPGEAKVHVSIVNWMRNIPENYFLDGKKVSHINSNLTSHEDMSRAKTIKENLEKSFIGCQLTGKGFLISQEKAREWIKIDKKNQNVLKPIIRGQDLINPNRKLSWVIDFLDMPIEEAMNYRLPFNHLKKTVKPFRDKNNDAKLRKYWWQFERMRPAMRQAIQKLKCYFAIVELSKYTYFYPIPTHILPHNTLIACSSDDFYILGILNSKFHHEWRVEMASTFGKGQRYNNKRCFEKFPFPQNVSENKKDNVRKIMKEIQDFRQSMSLEKNISMTQIYNELIDEPASKLHKLHQELDNAVSRAYGWEHDVNKNYGQELYTLNQHLTS